MTSINKRVRRDVIPRWRLSASRTDLDSSPAGKQRVDLETGPQQDPDELLQQFSISGKPMFASEALSSALVLGDRVVAEKAANLLKKIDLRTHPALESQVERLLDHDREIQRPAATTLEGKSRLQIQKFKRILRGYPRNPLAWLDLAFAYSAIGQIDQAKNAVLAAISLEKNNRGVVRAASRFFVHKGEFERALAVISGSALLSGDPWLVSAHIATARAGGGASKFIPIGRKMFKNENFRIDQLSELGAALATNEVEHGNAKLAHRLVSRAVQKPTENAVAQIGWLETTSGVDFEAKKIAASLPNAWEARTFEAFESADWKQSCEEAKQWLCDQPFSSRPAVHGSYVASTYLEDHELSLSFAEAGYLANPTDTIVANNYAVALAEVGRVKEARKVFTDISSDTAAKWKWTLQATEGLLEYREGGIEIGRSAYKQARERFVEMGDLRSELLASIYQAREEVRLGNFSQARALIMPMLDKTESKKFIEFDGLKKVAQQIALKEE